MEKQPSLCGEPLENASLSLEWKGLPPRERFFQDVPDKERTTNKPIATNKKERTLWQAVQREQ